MNAPIEVALVRRRRSGKETVLALAGIAGYLLAVKVVEDVATGSWQHSTIRLRLLELRDRVAAMRDRAEQTAQFQEAVQRTLDRLETIDTTEEVES